MKREPAPFGILVALLVSVLYMATLAAVNTRHPGSVRWYASRRPVPLVAILAGVMAYFMRRRWP